MRTDAASRTAAQWKDEGRGVQPPAPFSQFRPRLRGEKPNLPGENDAFAFVRAIEKTLSPTTPNPSIPEEAR